eukprot:TRINITY_DN67248_c0_g1_i1.p1 TRINITY_DN67248_c0_g1~~TRINITY_DN67248_c0_g1_i1.p1  ORF type:complete len:295 (+),score=64.91 TRINITY_DN67248_c0_g1_i1:72-956(+)
MCFPTDGTLRQSEAAAGDQAQAAEALSPGHGDCSGKAVNEGTLKSVFKQKGFGFVRADDGCDVFLHSSDLRCGWGIDCLAVGQRIRYDAEPGVKGAKIRARNAEVLASDGSALPPPEPRRGGRQGQQARKGPPAARAERGGDTGRDRDRHRVGAVRPPDEIAPEGGVTEALDEHEASGPSYTREALLALKGALARDCDGHGSADANAAHAGGVLRAVWMPRGEQARFPWTQVACGTESTDSVAPALLRAEAACFVPSKDDTGAEAVTTVADLFKWFRSTQQTRVAGAASPPPLA